MTSDGAQLAEDRRDVKRHGRAVGQGVDVGVIDVRKGAQKGELRLTGDLLRVRVVVGGRYRAYVDEDESDAGELASAALGGNQGRVIDRPESVGRDDDHGKTEERGEGSDVEIGAPGGKKATGSFDEQCVSAGRQFSRRPDQGDEIDGASFEPSGDGGCHWCSERVGADLGEREGCGRRCLNEIEGVARWMVPAASLDGLEG